jgi:hypothetical protein
MAETLGSLCDKLTIVKLKQYHSEDADRLKSLASQQQQLEDEINEFVAKALLGEIPIARLTFAANKVFNQKKSVVAEVTGEIGAVFAQLADANCRLWHEQEKVYNFEKIPNEAKDTVVKQLAVLNLERTKCIDQIDKKFAEAVISASTPKSAD